MNKQALDTLATRLGHSALTTLLRICPQIRHAPASQQEAACAAMRAQVPQVLDHLLVKENAAPLVANAAFALAALTLAQAGAQALEQASSPASD